MELRVLSYFLTIASVGSINKASEALHITQPTLSRQIKNLEDELGVVLFERGSKKISLTEEGLLLKRRAEEMLKLEEKTKNELQSKEHDIAGTIVLGCGELDVMSKICDVISEFSQKYPLVKFELMTGFADNIKEKMEHGLCDIGVFLTPVNLDNYNSIKLNNTELFGVIMRPDDSLANKDSITPNDLTGRIICLPYRLGVQNELSQWFGSYFNKLDIRFTADMSTNASIIVRKRSALFLTIKGSLPFLDENKLIFRELSPTLHFDTIIAMRKNVPQNAAVNKFVEFIRSDLATFSD